MNTEPEDYPVKRQGNDEALEPKGECSGNKEVRPLLYPGFPCDSQRKDGGLNGEGVQHGKHAILIDEREADHEHQPGKKMRYGIGLGNHPSSSWVRNDSKIARDAKINATPKNSLTRKTRILAILTSHIPRAMAPISILST